jgi:hypothetical protein
MTELDKMGINPLALMAACGGQEYAAYPVSHWKKAVAQGRTRLGYWEWVAAWLESER